MEDDKRRLMLTQRQLYIIREEIESTLEYIEISLIDDTLNVEDREDVIGSAIACRDILDQLDKFKHWSE